MKFLSFFNLRTFLVLVISQAATFFTIQYQIKFSTDLLLFGLAIGFPLAFSIQSAFKRRERALEYLSLFKAGTLAMHHSFSISEDLSAEKKTEARSLISKLINQVSNQLTQRIAPFSLVQEKLTEIMSFIEQHREAISNRNIMRMIRYLRDITESSAYLISLINHRTMVGLRFYSLAFISIFPILQAPMIVSRLGDTFPVWCLYAFMGISGLLLITLHNFQKMIEYPFDPKGMDNIQVDDFKLNQ